MEIVSQASSQDVIRIGGRWVIGTPEDVLLPDKLRPRVDPRTLTFIYGWSEETLNQWSGLGVLRQYLVDRVLLCDRCGSIPSWRNGCHVCGSGRIHRDRLVHHFACAHVGRASEFETAAGLQCPKCRSANLIVGSDYEFIEGPVECYDCGAKGGQPTMAAMCHRCHRRFSLEEAEERLLHAYHVERLDPLAFYGS
jgi:Zn finger protein HypA/HybF involved in hydrogenase expression